MRLVNLTPHEIVISPAGAQELRLPPSGQVARVETEQVLDGLAMVDGLPISIVRTRFRHIVDLPPPEEGVLYLASTLVAQAAAERGRRDVVAPDTGPASAIRDEEGRIVAVRRLQTWAVSQPSAAERG